MEARLSDEKGWVVYKIDPKDGRKWYCTGIPRDDNPLGGIGYQRNSETDEVIYEAATAPTEADAMKVIAYLDEACGCKHYTMPDPR